MQLPSPPDLSPCSGSGGTPRRAHSHSDTLLLPLFFLPLGGIAAAKSFFSSGKQQQAADFALLFPLLQELGAQN
jgi:hypothetical protein